MDMDDPNKYRESAADRAHGTQGRGRTGERRLDEPVVDPGVERGLGEPGWGSEASGGSSIDKRSPKKSRSESSPSDPASSESE